jgi:hypothetical protein
MYACRLNMRHTIAVDRLYIVLTLLLEEIENRKVQDEYEQSQSSACSKVSLRYKVITHKQLQASSSGWMLCVLNQIYNG